MTTRQLAELLVGVVEETEDRLIEIVAPGDDAVHVVLLVLHRTEEHRILQVDHRRHPAPSGTEEQPLGFCGALDDVVGSTEKLAQQVRLSFVEGPFQVRGEEPVLDVHPRIERKLGDLAEDDGLVGRLL